MSAAATASSPPPTASLSTDNFTHGRFTAERGGIHPSEASEVQRSKAHRSCQPLRYTCMSGNTDCRGLGGLGGEMNENTGAASYLTPERKEMQGKKTENA